MNVHITQSSIMEKGVTTLKIVRHGDAPFGDLSEKGREQSISRGIKILDFVKENGIDKVVIIYDHNHYRTEDTARIVYELLEIQKCNVEIVSFEDSIQGLFLAHFTAYDFLKTRQESENQSILGIIVGSCGDIPFFFNMMKLTDAEYDARDFERILGNCESLNINTLLEEKPDKGFTIEELGSFVR
ncbi:MAG: hypothetical protein K9M36_01935 [Candidatus Pacebacteria bacterium]|nr:hypothetical protein [Candidatus Paceibacterota bacterium]